LPGPPDGSNHDQEDVQMNSWNLTITLRPFPHGCGLVHFFCCCCRFSLSILRSYVDKLLTANTDKMTQIGHCVPFFCHPKSHHQTYEVLLRCTVTGEQLEPWLENSWCIKCVFLIQWFPICNACRLYLMSNYD
jgi:hypothetical protein